VRQIYCLGISATLFVNGSPKEGIVVQHEVSYDPKKGLVVKAYDTKKRYTLTGEATTQWFDGIMNDLLG
jgi:hypothetical protein